MPIPTGGHLEKVLTLREHGFIRSTCRQCKRRRFWSDEPIEEDY